MKEISDILNSEIGVDIMELRKCFLKKGVPDFTQDALLRSKIWKVLLGVPCLFDSDFYLAKIEVPSLLNSSPGHVLILFYIHRVVHQS
jgi:hypothetical protein